MVETNRYAVFDPFRKRASKDKNKYQKANRQKRENVAFYRFRLQFESASFSEAFLSLYVYASGFSNIFDSDGILELNPQKGRDDLR